MAAIIPATFLQPGLSRDRLRSYTLLHGMRFSNTRIRSAFLFDDAMDSMTTHRNDRSIGNLRDLETWPPRNGRDRKVGFNDPKERLGFVPSGNIGGPSFRILEAGSRKPARSRCRRCSSRGATETSDRICRDRPICRIRGRMAQTGRCRLPHPAQGHPRRRASPPTHVLRLDRGIHQCQAVPAGHESPTRLFVPGGQQIGGAAGLQTSGISRGPGPA